MSESGSGITREGALATGAGAILALGVLAVPFADAVLSYFGVLAHEMGHALVGWLYGYPSIPAFDFVYGGGVTSHGERLPLLAALVQAALLGAVWLFRRNPASLALATALCIGYAATAWTSLHEPVITAMGHGTELVIAGIFLHRSLGGRACHHTAERVTYAAVGAHLVLHNLRFAHQLVTSDFHRGLYEGAKGGGHWMDFSVLADQYFHVPLQTVAEVYFVLCLLPPLLALAGHHYHDRTAAWIGRLRQV